MLHNAFIPKTRTGSIFVFKRKFVRFCTRLLIAATLTMGWVNEGWAAKTAGRDILTNLNSEQLIAHALSWVTNLSNKVRMHSPFSLQVKQKYKLGHIILNKFYSILSEPNPTNSLPQLEASLFIVLYFLEEKTSAWHKMKINDTFNNLKILIAHINSSLDDDKRAEILESKPSFHKSINPFLPALQGLDSMLNSTDEDIKGADFFEKTKAAQKTIKSSDYTLDSPWESEDDFLNLILNTRAIAIYYLKNLYQEHELQAEAMEWLFKDLDKAL